MEPTDIRPIEIAVAKLEERVSQNEKLTKAHFVALEAAVKNSNESSDRALQKAEVAQEKRLDSVNEFRGQLKDQTATFITRNEYSQAHQFITDKLAGLENKIALSEGAKTGIGIGWELIIGIIGILGIVSTFIFTLLRK